MSIILVMLLDMNVLNEDILTSVVGRQTVQKVVPCLTYAGAIPFILCALCLVFDIGQLPVLGSVERGLSVYALVISSFLAGAFWGQHLQAEGKWGRILPILSNVTAVVLWLGFMTLSFKALMALFVVAFFVFLIIDRQLFQDTLITQQYFHTRCVVSGIVILTLIISGVFS